MVDIQTKTEGETVNGDLTETWSTDHQRKALILPLSGNETFQANQVDARLTHRIVMHKQGLTLTESQRIKFGTRIFNIKAVMDIEERGRKVVVMCIENTTNPDT